MVNPIVDWTDEEVWEYIHQQNLPYCELYDQGYTRIGCIGCPLAGAEKMKRDFERYPKYRDNYIRAFDRMIKAHPNEIKVATGIPAENGGGTRRMGAMVWSTATRIMKWWIWMAQGERSGRGQNPMYNTSKSETDMTNTNGG